MEFSGSQYLSTALAGNALFNGSDSTIYLVQKDNGVANGTTVLWSNGSDFLSVNAANNNQIVYDSGSGSDFVTPSVDTGTFYTTWHVIALRRQGTTYTVDVDGTPRLPGAGPAGSAASLTSGNLFVGNGSVEGTALNGAIAEVVVYPTALSDTDFAANEAALATQWDLTAVPEPQTYASVFAVGCLVAGLAA